MVYNRRMQSRNTNQRKIILQAMIGNYNHPTADEIYELVRKIDPHISRGTVYRNLAFLSESGEILKINTPNGPDHYDCQIHEHYHFSCDNCQKIYDVPQSARLELEAAKNELTGNGFFISGQNLILTGYCPECAKQKNTAGGKNE